MHREHLEHYLDLSLKRKLDKLKQIDFTLDVEGGDCESLEDYRQLAEEWTNQFRIAILKKLFEAFPLLAEVKDPHRFEEIVELLILATVVETLRNIGGR